jgi:hypothetical protein
MGSMGQKFQSSTWNYQATWKGDLVNVTYHKSVNVSNVQGVIIRQLRKLLIRQLIKLLRILWPNMPKSRNLISGNTKG